VFIVLNERLSLTTPEAEVGAREVSRAFRMPEGDNSVFIAIVFLAVTGTSPGVVATLEGSDDGENWSDSGSLTTPVAVGTVFGFSALLAAKLYRINWLFGSFVSAATVILAANVETRHA
jgi:hypothetical protein